MDCVSIGWLTSSYFLFMKIPWNFNFFLCSCYLSLLFFNILTTLNNNTTHPRNNNPHNIRDIIITFYRIKFYPSNSIFSTYSVSIYLIDWVYITPSLPSTSIATSFPFRKLTEFKIIKKTTKIPPFLIRFFYFFEK